MDSTISKTNIKLGKSISNLENLKLHQEKLTADFQELTKDEKRFTKAVIKGWLSDDEADAERKALDQRRNELDTKLEEVETKIALDEKEAETVEQVQQSRRAIKRRFKHLNRISKLSNQSKQDILRVLFPINSDAQIVVHLADENTPDDSYDPEPLKVLPPEERILPPLKSRQERESRKQNVKQGRKTRRWYIEIDGLLPINQLYNKPSFKYLLP